MPSKSEKVESARNNLVHEALQYAASEIINPDSINMSRRIHEDNLEILARQFVAELNNDSGR